MCACGNFWARLGLYGQKTQPESVEIQQQGSPCDSNEGRIKIYKYIRYNSIAEELLIFEKTRPLQLPTTWYFYGTNPEI